ncbi:G-protein coupled receptor 54-like [Acanthaster planci]|uniref:G-protein coupled receptor 54-like n=1 Tax=Acanthaster planci TaxID=133434 RepID=A0A8B7YXN8_ACAPL|nr:G-protein coupled receptor 54-like [Acanthaster planci]XP_022098099.1 G-protein coupled receptor 54-like [Acanthaster planci]
MNSWNVTTTNSPSLVTVDTTNNFAVGPTDGLPTEEFVFSSAAKIALTVVISVVAATGLFGNAMVVFIVIRYKDMHTVINYSFANLALTDMTLLLLDAVPTAADTAGINLSALLGCRAPIYLQFVTAEVTSLTLAFLSYDRYRHILHPLETLHQRSSGTLLKIFLSIWLVSFVVQIPSVLFAGLTAEGACSEYNAPWGQQYFFSYIFLFAYIVPFSIIVMCYLRIGRKMREAGLPSSLTANRRRRTVNITLTVIILYALCCAPVHIVHMWMAFDPEVTPKSPRYVELHTVANVVMFFNSSANPFVYALIGQSFRKHMKGMVKSTAECHMKCVAPNPRIKSRQSETEPQTAHISSKQTVWSSENSLSTWL